MSEPYSPIDLSTLGIEYIQEDIDSKQWEVIDYKNSLLKKKIILQTLANEIKKREVKNNVKVKKRLFA